MNQTVILMKTMKIFSQKMMLMPLLCPLLKTHRIQLLNQRVKQITAVHLYLRMKQMAEKIISKALLDEQAFTG